MFHTGAGRSGGAQRHRERRALQCYRKLLQYTGNHGQRYQETAHIFEGSLSARTLSRATRKMELEILAGSSYYAAAWATREMDSAGG
jgi:hypothetical protein